VLFFEVRRMAESCGVLTKFFNLNDCI
jgi:hypothetical protein